MVIELQNRPGHNRSWGRPLFEASSSGAWAWAAAAGALYFLVAWLAILITSPEGVAQFWPEEMVSFHLREVNHRAKNMLGLVC